MCVWISLDFVLDLQEPFLTLRVCACPWLR